MSIPQIPLGLCQCGCGQPTKIATRTFGAYNIIKGRPLRYIQHHYKPQPLRQKPRKAETEGDLIKIPLTKGAVCTISSEDADLAQFRWHIGSGGYAIRSTPMRYGVQQGPKHIRMHRVILERMIDRTLQADEECDHIDGDRLNNQRTNLRLAKHYQNGLNQKAPTNNTSGYKGVAWSKAAGKWRALIKVRGKQHYLGLYATAQEAHIAYERAAIEYFGEWHRSNE
jgi:hypothetical protein